MPRTIERFGAPASHSGARTRAASQDDLAAAAWNRRDWRSGCASGFGSGRSTGVAIHRTVQTVARVVDGTMYFRKAGWILMYCNFLQTGKPLVSTDSPFNVPGHACRPGCGACCIAPSITTPIPGMPHGKPRAFGVFSFRTICAAGSSARRSGLPAAPASILRWKCAANRAARP